MKVSKTAIFLFELMVVILVFSIAAAICSNIFAKAYNFSTDSKALTMAVIKAESAAEAFKVGAYNGDAQYFDEDWKTSTEDKAVYAIRSETAQEGALDVCRITVTNDDKEQLIYDLEVKSYDQS
jgi:Tfp pilus assembly protein PilE